MNKRIFKNSKKGFSLPAAIGVTAVLVILSASLIIIAANSISNTSSSLNSRQAYLNVKSALQYAEAYYNGKNVKVLAAKSTGGNDVKEYLVMNDDVGGTVSEGATVSDDQATTQGKTTYVVAKYTPAKGGDKPKLKLTAYANYSDAFGNKGMTTQLSVTYDATNGGSGRRITDPTIPPSVGVKSYNNSITLNVKKRPDQEWGSIAYYLWTFEDVAKAYNNSSKSGSDGSYEYKPTLEDANKNETDANLRRPAGPWVTSGTDDQKGPPALVSESGGGMLSSTFYTKNEFVNYFNIIFANKGALITQGDNSQSCEMFHLWYLDPSDKNIYFEFLQPKIYYYKASNWNGKTNLEAEGSSGKDYILVYVKNPKTTVHFKIKGIDDSAVVPTVSRPVINSVTVSDTPISGNSYLGNGSKEVKNLKMTYEGCGWWVANIETSDTFKMKITYSSESGATHTRTVTVTPNSDNEAWVYADMTSGTIQSRLSEQNANIALGVSSDSYVTIHAKAYDTKNKATPLLNYKDVGLNSSEGKINLYNKILEAKKYNESDYTEATYEVLKNVLHTDTGTGITDSSGNKIGAVAVYNDVDFINNQEGSTSAEKIENADKKYNAIVTEIDKAINGLVSKECDEDRLNTLLNLVKQGDDAVAEQSRSGKYDSGAYGVFIVDSGAYKTAKNMVANPSGLTIDEVETQITALQAALETLNEHVLDRTELENAINEAKKLSVNTRYKQDYRNDLKTQIAEAQAAYNKKETTQTALDTAKDNLQTKINDAPHHTIETSLNMEEIATAISEANDLLSGEKINCTNETYIDLKIAYDNANTTITSADVDQSKIDAEAINLKNAIKLFTVVKPDATNDKLDSEHKIRVWLSGTGEYVFTLDLYRENGKDSYKYSSTSLKSDEASGLSYIDINKTIYSKVGITITKDGEYYKSNEISIKDDGKELIDDNNLVVHFDGTFNDEELTCTVSQKQLTTLYIEKPDDSAYSPLVKVNGKEVKTSADDPYLAVRFISENGQKVVINSKSDGSGKNTNEFEVSAGQFVVRYKTDTDVELINVNSIYPIYKTTTASSTGYKISYATIDAENLISPTILANATSGYLIKLTDSSKQTYEEPIDIEVPQDKSVVIIDTTDVDFNGKIPYGYFWKKVGGSNQDIGASWPGSDTPPPITRISAAVDADNMTARDISMAYVGGNKVRITNKSYIETYPSGGKKNQNHSGDISNGNKFGGDGSGQFRVGDSKLSPYYDWYEFKIPVDKVANYTFDIEGLKGGSSTTLTKQISGAFGDVWITLNGDSKADGRYEDLSVYTFDPEKNQMEYVYDNSTKQMKEQTRIYFNMPAVWKDAKVTVSGVGTTKTIQFTDSNKMSTYGSNPSVVNYYYVDIDINTPFLEFNATKDDDTAFQCKTSLQGGDTVLFDPTMNGGYGGWNDYVSPQTLLYREALKAQNIYYGYVIIGKYDDNGYIEGNGDKTYNYAENLLEQYKDFTRHDASDKPDKTISLEKIYKLSNANADQEYTTLNEWVTAYENLYSAMSSAKAYIAKPITGGVHPDTSSGVYPEYKNRNNYQKYDTGNLEKKLKEAESKYLSSSVSVDELKTATRNLKTAISNVTVTSEGSITVIFYDSQEVAKNGAKIEVEYTGPEKDSNGNIILDSAGNIKFKTIPDKKEVTSKNPEGYPIIRIPETTIKNVTFLVNGVARNMPKDEMLENSTWVFIDQKGNPEWKENTTCDYVTINTDSFEQDCERNSDGSFKKDTEGKIITEHYRIKMKKLEGEKDTTVYKDIVLYFNQNTTVTRVKDDTTGETEQFTIKAGAYVFTNSDTKLPGSPFERKKTQISGTTEYEYFCEFDLYSEKSKNYFTDPVNYGKIPGAKEASELGWINSSGALTGSFKTTHNSVNITAMNTTINSFRKYTSLQSMSFRYEDNDHNFVVNNTLTLTAKDFVIASSSAFDGTHTIAPHFYLNSADYSSNKPLQVTFKSDINVKYRDNTGANHSFIIREGTYELSKKTNSQSYVADFFDESYWKSPFVVCTTNGGGLSFGGGKGGSLSNPVYSDD